VEKPYAIFSLAAAAFSGAIAGCGALTEGNVAAGKQLFEEQCIACHTAEPDDGGGMQGPSLSGLIGRPAGRETAFPYYSKQLRDSGLTWDVASLDRFLAAPEQTVPGTAMVLTVPRREDRENLIAYLRSTAAAHRP
jgi:cytochrome c2